MPSPEALVRPIAIAVLVAGCLLLLLWVSQRRLVYFPSAAVPDEGLLPAGAERLELRTDDGLTLGAWFLPPQAGPAPESAGPGPGVLVLNGNAGDRSHRLGLANALARRGFAVLVFDYRGYAGNPGSPTEAGLRADARAAADALAGRPEVDPDRIAYFGESLGAAVAGGLATERAPAALVLRSPPPSLAEVGRHHYPWLPIVDPLLFDRYPLAEQIAGVRVPLLVLVAEHDEVVPPAMSRRVFDAAPGPKRYVVIPGARHNDPALFEGEALIAETTAFLEEWLGP